MPKTKSPKKSDKKKSKPDLDTQIFETLNLPESELRRLSAAMAREEARMATPMDVDNNAMTNGSSQPATPSREGPGAFPESDADADANSASDRDEKSPTPPPHRVTPPKVDPEACKASGNKYFKAKDYDRAIQEYTKGTFI
jgi:DnaJ homolog subfamily C member 7